ncbi:MAG: EF-hand domain-containing protein [Rhodospirillaceae bacterium]|nr:EF-hand domain-containing protein [Rhodospirillaceae bacterium]
MRTLPLLLAAGLIGLTAAAAPANAHRGLRMFDRADANKDGKVTRAEFTAARSARFAGIDANKDGALEVSELRAWKRTWPSRARDARFKALDADGDGKIGVEEFVAQRKAQFTGIDSDKNGAVDKAEFDAAFDKVRERMLAYYGGHGGKRRHRWRKRHGSGMERRMDLNGDGKVTRAEFDTLGQMMFLRLDGDGDGAVTRKEMRMAFRRFDRHGHRR